MWGPRSIAKLVHTTPITMVYGTQITIVMGVYKPTYTGGPHIVSPDQCISLVNVDDVSPSLNPVSGCNKNLHFAIKLPSDVPSCKQQ